MPELPEVEAMVERLQRWVGHNIVSADGRAPGYLDGNERVFITGQKINGIFRRGKFIIFMLDKGALLCHNAMSGYWDSDDDRWTFDYVEGKRASRDSDIRALLLLCPPGAVLSEKGRNVFFHDARKFGYLKYIEPVELASKLSSLGPEIVATRNIYEPVPYMKFEEFKSLMRASKKAIKEVLMDQTKIAGVGNIYAAEACWHARLSPFRTGDSLGDGAVFQLYEGVRVSLLSAISGMLDYSRLKIYRRKTCPQCGGPVSSEKLKGRTTHWCPICQK